MARISVFFDGGAFHDGLRWQGFSRDVDLMGLARELAGGELGEVHYYMPVFPDGAYPAKHANQKAFRERLRKQGVIVHETDIQIMDSKFVERGVEAALATDVVEGAYAGTFDGAVLVSRRAAFRPTVEAVKRAGRTVTAAFFRYAFDPVDGLRGLCASKDLTPEIIIRHTKSGPIPPGHSKG